MNLNQRSSVLIQGRWAVLGKSCYYNAWIMYSHDSTLKTALM